MILLKGEKLHINYRALFENSIRRHFIGQVVHAEAALCRLRGYSFVYDMKSTTYVRKPELRTTIVNLADSGYIATFLPHEVQLAEIYYTYVRDIGLVATDGKGFTLDINEFNLKA